MVTCGEMSPSRLSNDAVCIYNVAYIQQRTVFAADKFSIINNI